MQRMRLNNVAGVAAIRHSKQKYGEVSELRRVSSRAIANTVTANEMEAYESRTSSGGKRMCVTAMPSMKYASAVGDHRAEARERRQLFCLVFG